MCLMGREEDEGEEEEKEGLLGERVMRRGTEGQRRGKTRDGGVDTSHSCSHLAAIHTIPWLHDTPFQTHTHTHRL